MSKCLAKPKPETTDGLGMGMRVLVGNDDRDTLMNLGILLRSEGFEVLLLEDGVAAGDAVRAFRPHAVLLDLGRPGGYAIAAELAKEHGASCPVLDVTKPYDPDALLTLVASCRPEK